jgi:hypothetical protein
MNAEQAQDALNTQIRDRAQTAGMTNLEISSEGNKVTFSYNGKSVSTELRGSRVVVSTPTVPFVVVPLSGDITGEQVKITAEIAERYLLPNT